MLSHLGAVVAAGFLLSGLRPAAAETIQYNIFGNCNGTCANAGLSRGNIVFGTLALERDSIVIGGTFDETDLVSFSVTFGANTISTANAAGASLVGIWGNDLTTIAALDLRASTTITPNSGLGLLLMLGASIVSTSASCGDAACDALGWANAATLSGVTVRETSRPSPVPLPPALLLALAGPGALAFAALRHRRPTRGDGAR